MKTTEEHDTSFVLTELVGTFGDGLYVTPFFSGP